MWKEADGRRWKAQLLSWASWVLYEITDLKTLHSQPLQPYRYQDQGFRLSRSQAAYGHLLPRQTARVPPLHLYTLSQTKSSLLQPVPLSLTRTPYQSLIHFSEGLSGVTRLGRHHSSRLKQPVSSNVWPFLPFINRNSKRLYAWCILPPDKSLHTLFSDS